MGGVNFTESEMGREVARGGEAVTREEVGKRMNDAIFINQLKHMDDGEDGFVDFEPEECALAAILKAIANYVQLGGRNSGAVLAFMAWMKLNLDPKKYNIQCDPNWIEPT